MMYTLPARGMGLWMSFKGGLHWKCH